ncbi:MAG: CDP-diacylglycerol--serine O-phosphatidyltransferase [Proteobacteria bacterium]|nr:CDP-diacylglycerol--serine O-phosphatidyltransferase [Pseudomonadota bacterium]MBU1584288.1 CDP-diacylglycerol--serine O-phosphatidyltransferase [Pseudomonadota bacterium]MBU2455328.1 CDP-diacylglycerol--serine O-phosphatidyltransferase [Pseudomonadota bacterium]MBU2628175.1 CDP-diacylglycerol--serine O-phosphatidyltransferase [Pseudomonadota bacterium]
MHQQNIRKSIYILPNLFTSMNLFCGYYSITASVQLRFVDAAIAILVGAVFDLLDGKIARATHTTSKFGVEYDSLADLITFGLAPALLMLLWAFETTGRYGWSAALLFTMCGALRLARFNTSCSSGNDFEGLPIPAAAAMIVSTTLFFFRLGIDPESYKLILIVMMFALSFCMVSSFRYKSLKKVSFFKSMKFNKLVGLILIIAFIAAEPYILLFVVFLSYVISGPFLSLIYPSPLKENTKTQIDEEFYK